MKSEKKDQKTIQKTITQALLQELTDRHVLDCNKQNPLIGSEILKPANLYQDAGNGFNSNFTYPQD